MAPDWHSDPEDTDAYTRELAKYTVGELTRLTRQIELVDYDPSWPALFEQEAARIRAVLGERATRVEHVGSTSVPDLPAKPIIDIALEVPDSAVEPDYVPALEAAGYSLTIREPDWFEHRLLKGPAANINLHAFTAGCEEVERMVLFRDWLRVSSEDRELYARSKRRLASRHWKYVQQYADAKTSVVNEIMARAEASRPFLK